MTPHNSPDMNSLVEQGVCSRCHGFMVQSFTGSLLMDLAREFVAPAWRCVNCGQWIDAMISENRLSAGETDRPSTDMVSTFQRRKRRW